MEKQPVLNVGCLGSVSNGKSTMVKLLTGISTQRFSKEKVRNITMKVGYANVKIWECPTCEHPQNLSSSDSSLMEYECKYCNSKSKLIHHFSFVDCPGHHELITNMMSGVSVMDGAVIVVTAAEPLSAQIQLKHHVNTCKIANMTKLIFVINKCDLVKKEIVNKRKEELEEFVKANNINAEIIIPTSFSLGLNYHWLLSYLVKTFPIHDKKIVSDDVRFIITRSFDINKPGQELEALEGGVIGGSLLSGNLKIGDEIEIRPGVISTIDKKVSYKPIKSKVYGIKSDNNELAEAGAGGLLGIKLDVDPYYTKNDGLKGQVMGLSGKLPNVYSGITCQYTEIDEYNPIAKKVDQLQIGSQTLNAMIQSVTDNIIEYAFNRPCCFYENDPIIICQKTNVTVIPVAFAKFIKGVSI
jgi:translation initiation factor 2 subunit 3